MIKRFTRYFFLLLSFTLLTFTIARAQTITIGNVAGTYGKGSTISVPFEVSGGCIPIGNIFSLYISDNTGNFPASPVLVDTLKTFYATFFNTTVPALPGIYKYFIKATSAGNPAVTSGISGPITVTAAPGAQAGITSPSINAQFPNIFGSCIGPSTSPYSFSNTSSTTSVTATFFDELAQTQQGGTVNMSAPYNFTAATTNYTIMVTATGPGGIIGTEAYQLINNSINSSLGSSNNAPVCLSSGNSAFTFYIDPTSKGILYNYPGNIYTISWDDNSPPSDYTPCQIIEMNGLVSHTFLKTSCGITSNGHPNSYEVNFQPKSPYCGYGATTTSYVKVLSPPKNAIGGAASIKGAACINTAITFENNSDPGEDPTAMSSSCSNENALYTWTVDNTTTFINYPLSKPLIYTFTTAGPHTVTLHLQPNNHTLCSADDITITICVQNPPQPKFALSAGVGCAPFTVTTTNSSVIDNNCSNVNQYVWTVTGPNGFSYTGGTSGSSAQPQFSFSNAGAYNVTLGITTASCGTITTNPQTIVVDSASVAQLSPDITLCGDRPLAFDSTASPTHTILNGQTPIDTYLWTVTGDPNYTFQSPTNPNSKYPIINFTDTATYTITVVHKNQCGASSTSTQHITFKNSPVLTAGRYATVCPGSPISLNGTTTEQKLVKSIQWVSSGTGIFSSPNTLATTYTPSAADITNHKVTFTLNAVSLLPAPCNELSDTTTVNIYPADTLTSASSLAICSGTALNYNITSSIPGATFTWQVVGTTNTKIIQAGTSGTVITDVLSSLDTGYAVDKYIITPQTPTCTGTPDTLTVTVSPAQAIASFTVDTSSTCGNLVANFINTSTPQNSKYLWDFGDGTTSTLTTPAAHTFQTTASGNDTTYTVTLKILTSCGNSIPATAKIKVRPAAPSSAIFPANGVFSGCSPFVLTMNNLTANINKSYTYYLYQSDGTTLVQQITTTSKNPVTFNAISTNTTRQYIVYMSTQNLCGVSDTTKHINITVTAQTLFAGLQPVNAANQFTNTGCAPLAVSFVNLSVGGSQYSYTIYDATKTPIGQPLVAGAANYPYTFSTAGQYYVSITASNSCATAPVTSELIPVIVYAVPQAGFSADTVAGCRSVTVNFTNLQAQQGVLYNWDFGDGTNFTGPTPPAHSYSPKNSPYTVKLTATNSQACSDTSVQKDLITVSSPPAPAFMVAPDSIISIPNYHVDFVDQSSNNPAVWNWTFGDGTSSTLENPGHTYTYGDTGIHKVTLVVYNKLGCDSTISHNVLITGVPGQLFMPNAFIPASGNTALKIFMAKGSGIKTWHLQVFNNYGQLIWETTKLDDKGAPLEGWDGTFKGAPAPQGSYIWQASATFINGSQWKGMSYNNSLPKTTGTIILIR
jgi:PKD repeat protein